MACAKDGIWSWICASSLYALLGRGLSLLHECQNELCGPIDLEASPPQGHTSTRRNKSRTFGLPTCWYWLHKRHLNVLPLLWFSRIISKWGISRDWMTNSRAKRLLRSRLFNCSETTKVDSVVGRMEGSLKSQSFKIVKVEQFQPVQILIEFLDFPRSALPLTYLLCSRLSLVGLQMLDEDPFSGWRALRRL